MDVFAQQALLDCISETNSVKRGGVNGMPYWNVNALQFIYAPAFLFPSIPWSSEYRFTATDSKEQTYTFTANAPTASLAPIWNDLAVGVVTLKVEAPHLRSNTSYLVGTRTFFKAAPFPGRSALPPRACSYKESALKAFRYVFNDPSTRHWLTHGTPNPEYYHNVYPAKMISSIINGMVQYAKMEPEHADEALKLAANAADYMLSITFDGDSPVAGLPPTYSFRGLNREVVMKNAPAADTRKNLLMMIYPAAAGSAYLNLARAVNNPKYTEAARRIAEYYKAHVLPNGSWHLLVSIEDGSSVSPNFCCTFDILNFLTAFYDVTQESCWKELADHYYASMLLPRLFNYNWEGQFEDSVLSNNYSNLTHYGAGNMILYVINHLSDDDAMVAEAETLVRFVEDQFVAWGPFAPWSVRYVPNESVWYSPAGLEQYNWLVPIDASTSHIARTFLALYRKTGKPIYLEKALALADSITRMQNPESGVYPTHWMQKDCTYHLQNFWLNCHIATASALAEVAKAVGEW